MKTTSTLSMHTVNHHSIAIAETLVDSTEKRIVVFCHGFRSSSIGPNRFFIKAAWKLAEKGISSVRFDQYGSGNSNGDFIESSFNDWVETTVALCNDYVLMGYKVALFGQSMGGSTVIVAGSRVPELSVVVSWVPDASVDRLEDNKTGYHEESGERVSMQFWQEAHSIGITEALSKLEAPTYIVQCGNDEYVSDENHKAIANHARPNHVVEMFHDYPHSRWTYEQANAIIDKSVEFISAHFQKEPRPIHITTHFKKALSLIKKLHTHKIDPILYGSTGVSYYLGKYKKKFSDIDLLISDEWLEEKWQKLIAVMNQIGYKLFDEHEHEFLHDSLPNIAFAKISILKRDNIVSGLSDIKNIQIHKETIHILSPEAFKKAYEFSIKDGYRIETGRKDDATVIKLLKEYIDAKN